MASTTTRRTERQERPQPSWRPIVSTTGDPAYSGVLQRNEAAAADARDMVRTCLSVWHLDQLAEDLALVATELVANAVRHARGEVVRVTVTRIARHRVRVAVTDRSKQMPQLRVGDPLAETGRGLLLVDGTTAGRWGVIPYNWGKQVWAEVGTT